MGHHKLKGGPKILPGEINLPDFTFTSQNADVNQLFNRLCIKSDTSFTRCFAQSFRQLQNDLYGKLKQQLLCPDCAGDLIIRKGWRKRHLKTSRGSFKLAVLQTNCKRCGRTFRPLNYLVGLPFSRRFLDEFVEKGIRVAVDLSFAKASRTIKTLTRSQMSAEAIRQKLHAKPRPSFFANIRS